MKKGLVVLVGLLVISTLGFFLFASGDDSTDTEMSNSQTDQERNSIPETATDTNTPAAEQPNAQTASAGLGYVDYSDETLAQAQGSKRVVFFHAPWCSVCNFYEGQIEEQGVPEGVSILKVDFDSETDLKERYGVSVQSTFVLLDDNGDIVESWPFARGLNGIQDLYDAVI